MLPRCTAPAWPQAASQTMTHGNISKLKVSTGIFTLLASVLFATAVAAQAGKAPTVTVAAVPLTTTPRAEQTPVSVNFRVPPGYHINSNTPKSEFLIPTALKMDLGSATDIVLGKIDYPQGQDVSFPFSPDEKLNVYTGDFTITLSVHPLKSVVPGKYALHGMLRYQACDNAACYPPKTLPVNFEIKVVKEKAGPRKNPAQSPHVHG
jgi:hypothetical protein